MGHTFQSFESLMKTGALGPNKLDRSHKIIEARKSADSQHLIHEARAFWQGDMNIIDADPKLTPEGKADKKRRISEAAIGKLEALREQRLFTIAGEKLKTVEAKIAQAMGEKDKSSWAAIRQWEIRREVLEPMRGFERKLHVLKALEAGDLETVDAALDAPGKPLLDPEDAAEVRQAVLERRVPELAEARKELSHATSVIEGELQATIEGIQKAAGLEPTFRERMGGGFDNLKPVEEPEPVEA